MIMKVHMRNFFLIITVFLFIIRIYTVWPLKYTKLLRRLGDFKNLFDFKDNHTIPILLGNTGAVIWNAIPINIKTATSLNNFKNRIKSWKPECSC